MSQKSEKTGIVVSNNPQSSSLQDWDLISDGAGGCVVAFTDTRSGPDLDVYAYRLDVNGNQLWGANGVTLSADADAESNPTLALTTDGSPSCGVARIADGDFSGKKRPGEGVAVRALRDAGVEVFGLDDIEALAARLDAPAD